MIPENHKNKYSISLIFGVFEVFRVFTNVSQTDLGMLSFCWDSKFRFTFLM